MEITLQDILTARENRVKKQRELLKKYQKPLICFTLNIAGPVKCDPHIIRGFTLGKRWLEIQLKDLSVLHRESLTLPTGCEGYYVVDAPAEELKLRTVQIEDSAPVARLFDMDVIDTGGQKLERTALGFSERKCLLCHKPAYVCSRSRAHSVKDLQAQTHRLLLDTEKQEICEKIAEIAQKSILFEVCTTPKPGLVDLRNSGSHKDMDIFTFMSSAASLYPYFYRCAMIGAENRNLTPKQVFSLLRFPGKVAENAMYRATNGVNTHKGIIFSLGILCAAAGYVFDKPYQPEQILQISKNMTQGIVKKELSSANGDSHGEKLYSRYGITGVRGQAEQGFPAVLQMGLPVLEKGLQTGLSLNDAGCAALLSLLTITQDTNLIHRCSLEEQKKLCREIEALLSRHPYPNREILEQLDDRFIDKNLSPGGCADLLALSYFLYFLSQTEVIP